MAASDGVSLDHERHVLHIKGGGISSLAYSLLVAQGFLCELVADREDDGATIILDAKYDEYEVEAAKFFLELKLKQLNFEVNPEIDETYFDASRVEVITGTYRHYRPP